MVGRARSAFYAFVTVLFVALLALAGTSSRLIGLAEIGVAVGVFALSSPFTLRAWRARTLNLVHAGVYHAGLVMVVVGGVVRAVQGAGRDSDLLLAIAVLLLLGIALSNSWQLVISHEADPEPEDGGADRGAGLDERAAAGDKGPSRQMSPIDRTNRGDSGTVVAPKQRGRLGLRARQDAGAGAGDDERDDRLALIRLDRDQRRVVDGGEHGVG